MVGPAGPAHTASTPWRSHPGPPDSGPNCLLFHLIHSSVRKTEAPRGRYHGTRRTPPEAAQIPGSEVKSSPATTGASSSPRRTSPLDMSPDPRLRARPALRAHAVAAPQVSTQGGCLHPAAWPPAVRCTSRPLHPWAAWPRRALVAPALAAWSPKPQGATTSHAWCRRPAAFSTVTWSPRGCARGALGCTNGEDRARRSLGERRKEPGTSHSHLRRVGGVGAARRDLRHVRSPGPRGLDLAPHLDGHLAPHASRNPR